MAFKQVGSYQKNAAPLQSAIKKAGKGQKTPDPSMSAQNPSVPRKKQRQMNGRPTPAPMPGFDPVFLSIMAKMMGGK